MPWTNLCFILIIALEESYKIGSVRSSFHLSIRPIRPSFRLSVGFLRISSLVFSETYRKNPHLAKMTENGQKWPQNEVFGLFRNIMSLVLSGICVKWKFLWFINILQKLHTWEKSGSQVIAKNGSQSMRFQYSLIVNISLIDEYLSDFDFWYVDRHE